MPYTVLPKANHAKAFGRNMRISTKHAALLCRVIRKKPLKRAKRLLEDLAAERRSLEGKHYTKTAKEVLSLLSSCEKNAEALGLDTAHLMVHASAHQGTHLRRRRRKQAFGMKLKSTNLEIILVEKIPYDYVKRAVKKQPPKKEPEKQIAGMQEIKEKSEKLREKTEELEKQVEEIVGKDIETHADKREKEEKGR